MLRGIPYRPSATEGSSKILATELEDKLVEICGVIDNYSFDILEYRVNKCKDKFRKIREYIEQERTYFTATHHSTLMKFCQHVDMISDVVANAHNMGRFPSGSTQMLIYIYSQWKEHNFLPLDGPRGNKITLLDHADEWLANSA